MVADSIGTFPATREPQVKLAIMRSGLNCLRCDRGLTKHKHSSGALPEAHAYPLPLQARILKATVYISEPGSVFIWGPGSRLGPGQSYSMGQLFLHSSSQTLILLPPASGPWDAAIRPQNWVSSKEETRPRDSLKLRDW